MSMADGYARLSGQLQCVLVHVDVGTQGLGAAVHNASTGRAPVLIFAGLSPATLDGEMRGSRTEFIHWLQDVPDQKLIVSQYMRYAQDIKTGKNIKQMVARALQFAMSGPQGPSYLCGAREVMEEEITPYSLRRDEWAPVQLGGLPEDAVRRVGIALLEAKEPLVVTGYVGRRHEAPDELVRLANTIKGLRVLDTGGSDMCFPSDHPGWLGLKFGFDKSIETADVILILDCDVPWIPTRCRPLSDARIFHIDVDPLKQMMPLFYVAAHERFRADSLAALRQLNHLLRSDDETQKLLTSKAAEFNSRWESLVESHRSRLADIAARATPLPALSTEEGSRVPFGTGYLCRRLRELCPEDTIWVIEAVTNTVFVHDNLAPTLPGSWINCGGGGLGWSGGAALGIKLASDTIAGGFGEQGWNKGKFVVAIVGDGSFLFSVPGSVFWIAKRYRIPVLTIVLNNNGKLVRSVMAECGQMHS